MHLNCESWQAKLCECRCCWAELPLLRRATQHTSHPCTFPAQQAAHTHTHLRRQRWQWPAPRTSAGWLSAAPAPGSGPPESCRAHKTSDGGSIRALYCLPPRPAHAKRSRSRLWEQQQPAQRSAAAHKPHLSCACSSSVASATASSKAARSSRPGAGGRPEERPAAGTGLGGCQSAPSQGRCLGNVSKAAALSKCWQSCTAVYA